MKKLIFGVLLFAPALTFANVRINEVAWMGDLVSSDHEWVELYNDADMAQNLSGWKLIGTDTVDDAKEKFSISLSGTISPKGFFLVERKRSSIDTAPYLSSDFTTVTFSLLNTGETLWLKNTEEGKIDEVRSFATKWPAGNNTTKETMQKNGAEWITAPATPRKINETVDTTASDTTATDTTTDTSDTATSHSSALDTSSHVSPLPLSDFSQKQELYISAGRNRIMAVGGLVSFEVFAVDSKGTKPQGIASVWSFGDGSQTNGTKVTHTYKHPGDYVVVLNANAGGNEAVSRAEVKVFVPKIILALESDGAISLQNDSSYEINIGGWKIAGVGGNFVASSDTIIKAGKKLIFSKAITGIDFSNDVSINFLSPDGSIVTTFTKQKPIEVMANTISEISVAPKNIEPITEEMDVPLIVVSTPNPETQTAGVALAVPEKVQEPKDSAPKQTIILKKPEGFFAKIWNFLFR
jgi:hypothetical protein